MEQAELLRHLVAVLERLNLEYFVTGSLASIAHGEPRMTIDIDVVVKLDLDRLDALCRAFPEPEYYLSKEAAIVAVRVATQFNVIHGESGQKIDLIVARRDPLTESQFKRRKTIRRKEGYEMHVAAPEDIILNKLLFYRMGESDKHLRDIAGIIKTMGPQLETGYIEEWAARLEVMDIWRAVQARVGA